MINQKVFIGFVVLFVILYLQNSLKYKSDIKIIQSSVENINIDVLHEKYPIVIYDRIIKPNELLKSLFAYTFVTSRISPFVLNANDKLIQNMAKYVILYNEILDVDIEIFHPKNNIKFSKLQSIQAFSDLASDVSFVTIKLRKNQVLILPMFWIFYSKYPLQSIQLYDSISFIYEKIWGSR